VCVCVCENIDARHENMHVDVYVHSYAPPWICRVCSLSTRQGCALDSNEIDDRARTIKQHEQNDLFSCVYKKKSRIGLL
jgi:hypothetical protein